MVFHVCDFRNVLSSAGVTADFERRCVMVYLLEDGVQTLKRDPFSGT